MTYVAVAVCLPTHFEAFLWHFLIDHEVAIFQRDSIPPILLDTDTHSKALFVLPVLLLLMGRFFLNVWY